MNSGRYTCKANNGALDSNKKEIMVTQTINLNVNCKCATHTLYMYWSSHCYEVIPVLVLSLSHYWVLHGGSRGGALGSLALPPPPLIFRQNWGPKGGKIFWGEHPPTLTPLPPPPFLIWRSGSATEPYRQCSKKVELVDRIFMVCDLCCHWSGWATLVWDPIWTKIAKKVGYTIMLIPDLMHLVLYICFKRGKLALFSLKCVVQLGSFFQKPCG